VNADVHTLTGAYALNALSDVERRQFERHLAECPDCAREVDELQATAARLAMAVSEPPPDRVKQDVLDVIRTTRQESPGGRRSVGEGRPPQWWALRLTAVAAVLALAAAVGLGSIALRTQHRLDAAQQVLSQAQAEFGPVAQVFAAPDARATTATAASGGTAVVMASKSLNEAVLMVAGMPAPTADHTYQAWVIKDGTAKSVGFLVPGANAVVPPLVFAGLTASAKIGVTVEPAGGSPKPTTTPLMLFSVVV
jgi:anti-sigma-K factor RskA